ncbi:glutamate acetyltransferase [Brasilonema octagenarum UFV-E1]|uniref:Glutamate acetyltransferase n=1 Tax=Brasilonema sennae CENA114 TaxID=415709 RepID=A0A856MAI1_9CYAN|nr:DALR anticodon-binding domain-containing protein [Brasilonema sennae]QDL08215.1 glutamate acetyltransferase [Brasilonema sennae CENA114]QDL14571.1 glutamate acetyltransferase [Brasilonema octagenarum UFV-E1]
MQNKSRKHKYKAIKQLVSSKIAIALSTYANFLHSECTNNINIPLSQGGYNGTILYISGIALRLAKFEKYPAIEIANGITSHISTNYDKDFKVQVVSPGWIHLELTHPLLAAWLQNLTVGGVIEQGALSREQGSKERLAGSKGDQERMSIGSFSMQHPIKSSISSFPFSSPNSGSLFTVQYAHARCCSLLRLGVHEGLIKLGESNVDQGDNVKQNLWSSIFTPNPIPWLNSDEKLRFNHPASYLLINELVRVVDKVEGSDFADSVNWEKAALDLSRVFETFWCKCQIFGKVKTASPELAQAKIGLVLATQSVLKFMLEEKLGYFALDEV